MQVAILLYPGFTALDLVGPYEVLHVNEEVEIRFVWKHVGPIIADSGVLIMAATHTLEETKKPDMLLIPGSSADTATTMADGEVLKWIREVHKHTQYTTSVCSGAMILAAAGVLEGKEATTHWMMTPGLELYGAIPQTGVRFVRSGKIWTSAGVSAGIDMMLTITGEHWGAEKAKTNQLIIEYAPEPPYHSGSVKTASAETIERAAAEMTRMAINFRDVISIPIILVRRFLELLAKAFRTREKLDKEDLRAFKKYRSLLWQSTDHLDQYMDPQEPLEEIEASPEEPEEPEEQPPANAP